MKNFPYIYEIEPTNHCPYSCYMCPRGRGAMTRDKGFMSLSTFERVLNQIPDDQRILRLHHFGEAIIHPDIYLFIEKTRKSGIIPAISLNPSTLNVQSIDNLIESGTGVVCFSLDSLRSERLQKIRGIKKTANYCLDMIDMFITKSRYANNHILKIVQMVSLDTNVDEREEFLALNSRYSENDVYIYISHNYGFGDINLVRETSPSDVPTVLEGAFPCHVPFDEIVVLWNGDVTLCCYDYNGFNVFGNINEKSIHEIWNGSRAEKLRKTFENKETYNLPLCNKCYLAPHGFAECSEHQQKGKWEENYILNMFGFFKTSDHA